MEKEIENIPFEERLTKLKKRLETTYDYVGCKVIARETIALADDLLVNLNMILDTEWKQE